MKSEKIKILFFILAFCFVGRGFAAGEASPQTVSLQTPSARGVKTSVKSSPIKSVAVKKTSTPIQASLPSIAQAPSQTQPQPVDFSVCVKSFKMDNDKLFYLTLAAVNANRFSIKEIQSNSGYVIFSAAQKQFLVSVIDMGAQYSLLKITPIDGAYFFPVGVVQNMFKYIELNFAFGVEPLSVLN